MNLKELKQKLQALLLQAQAICKTAEDAKRDFTEEERTKVAALLAEAGELKKKIAGLEADDAMRKQILELGAGLESAQGGPGAGGNGQAGHRRAIGEQFVEAEAYKAWLRQVAPTGLLSDGAKGLHSPPVQFKTLFKDLVTGASDTSGGAFVQTDYTGIYEPLGRRPRTMLDLIPRRTTTSDILEFVRQTTAVAQAAPVQEANVTTYSGATGEISGQKPEASLAYEKVTTTVKTIAVWIPATKRAISDAAQLRGLIDQELREDCLEALEDQVYDGDGVGENFTGITNTSGVLTQAWDTDIFRTVRKAKTALVTTGRVQPTGLVIHPNDWEAVELTQDSQNRYYYGGPINPGQKTMWGVPVVESENVHEGEGILADWRKCAIWDREQAAISVSDSHSDFFIRNMVAILCELRAAFGVIRPSAFCVIDLSSGS